MPFPFLTTIFGIVFTLIWVFIGGLIVRNEQLVVRRDHDRASGA
jgi:hypothetical protein